MDDNLVHIAVAIAEWILVAFVACSAVASALVVGLGLLDARNQRLYGSED